MTTASPGNSAARPSAFRSVCATSTVSTADPPRSRATSERIGARRGRCSCRYPIAPGHPQCDFGEALAVIGGVEQKAHCFPQDLPHSDGCFVMAYQAETTEAFLDGHVSAFAFLGGVPQSILYDNTKLAEARILGDGKRQRTRAFTELRSHYLFEDRFGRPAKGNDKGKVEGMVGYVRRNFLVPMPSFESFDALNAQLERRCLERKDARLRGHAETIGQRMERDLDALLPLPPVPYDA